MWDATTFSQQPSAVRPTKETAFGSSGWTTPTVDDANNVTRASGSQASLARDTFQFGQAESWPMPQTRDYKGESGTGRQERKGDPTETLANALTAWATPAAHEARLGFQDRTNGKAGSQESTTTDAIYFDGSRQRGQTPSPTVEPMAPSDLSRKPPSRGLNPRFALWLQGFPVTWFDGVETPKRGRKK